MARLMKRTSASRSRTCTRQAESTRTCSIASVCSRQRNSMSSRQRERRFVISFVSGLVVLCLAVPALLFYFGVGRYDYAPASRDADDAAKAYRAAGLPWTAQDLAPKPALGADENAAPILKEAVALLPQKDRYVEMLAVADAGDLGHFDLMAQNLAPFGKALDLTERATRMRGADFGHDWDLGPNL